MEAYNESTETCAKTIYRILTIFEESLDDEKFNLELITPEQLGITATRRNRYLQMLVESGYLTGIKITEAHERVMVSVLAPRITLKGIEYLAENSLMQKALKLIKGGANLATNLL